MKKLVLRKKSVSRSIQMLLFLSPVFFFYPLLLLLQIAVTGGAYLSNFMADMASVIQSAVWVCFLPPVYFAVLGGHYLNKVVLSKDAIYLGPFSAEKRLLDTLVEVGGEAGSVLNDYREGIVLRFDNGLEETLYLDDYDEKTLRDFINTLKNLRPDCIFSYGDVLPLESRGLIKFIYESSDSNSVIARQIKSHIEDSFFQLVNQQKKTFFSIYLAGWMVVVLIFTIMTVTCGKSITEAELRENIARQTFAQAKAAYPEAFKEGALYWKDSPEVESKVVERLVQDIGSKQWYQNLSLLWLVLYRGAASFFCSGAVLYQLIIVWSMSAMVAFVFLPIIRRMTPNFLFVDAKSIGQGMYFMPFEHVQFVELLADRAYSDPMDGYLRIHGADKILILRLDRIPQVTVRMKVLRLIERYAGEAHFNDEFLRATTVSADLNFTDLWLAQAGKDALIVEEEDFGTGKLDSTESERRRVGRGRYQIESVLGYGGQGTTYIASSLEEDETVVVKELVLPGNADVRILQNARIRFEHASQLLSAVKHSNIVSHREHFIEDTRAYLVMEYIPGKTLRQIVAEEGPLPSSKVRNIARQILEILSYLHNLPTPIIHCDLAPDNLILTEEGNVKLIDFDVARVDGDGRIAPQVVAARPAYTPPEQFRGRPVRESDIYAFGAILHFLLLGSDPAPLEGDRDRDGEARIPEDLKAIIEACSQFEASNRPAEADIVLSWLEEDDGSTLDLSEVEKTPKIA